MEQNEMKAAAMDGLLRQWLLAQLQTIGILAPGAGGQAPQALAACVQPPFRRWLDASLAQLQEAGLVRLEGGLWHADATLQAAEVARQWRQGREQWRMPPELAAYVTLLEATLEVLPAILTGRVRATDVLFPNGSMARVQDIYKNNHVADHFNQVLTENLVRYVEARIAHDPAVRLRMVEIGAGTGGTSGRLLEALRPYSGHIAEYAYTDLSKAFLQVGESQFGALAPYLKTALLDIEQPPAAQGFETGVYDIALATNVLHATRDIRGTVGHAKSLLRRNGLFFINEMIGSSIYLHLTFGLLDGWWRFEDDELRLPGSPGLSPENWEAVLRGEGYSGVLFPAKDVHHLGQQLIIAQSDGVLRTQRAAAPAQAPAAVPGATADVAVAPGVAADAALAFVTAQIAHVLRMPAQQILPEESLSSYGLDSILATQLAARLAETLGDIDSTAFFEHRTAAALCGYLLQHHGARLAAACGVAPPPSAAATAAVPSSAPAPAPAPAPAFPPSGAAAAAVAREPARGNDWEPIAIIGLAGRYAGAANVAEFWANLLAGRRSTGEIPATRWDWRRHYEADPAKAVQQLSSYGKWGGFLDHAGEFDTSLFTMPPREAEMTDPQELLFLETCWSAMRDAGCPPSSLTPEQRRGAGVFAAITKQYAFPPTSFASLANRVSYQLNFQGKSLAIDTMCSSSLVALHEACAYLQGEGRLALVGGVNLYLEPAKYVHLSASRFLAKGESCNAFGAGGEGFVPGEGVGAVVLKPLRLALEDGDSIYAVIRGSAVNHNGRSAGYTSSDPARQADVVRGALERAAVDPRSVAYIEAAANGIELGDAIEMSALGKVFGDGTGASGARRIGSVKPNIGHCEAASGMSQLTKVIMSLHQRVLAPTLLEGERNRHVDFTRLPFEVQLAAEPWQPLQIDGLDVPRRAGITGIGGGGVNAHVVLEEWVAPPRAAAPAQPSLLLLSAHTQEALRRTAADWIAHLPQLAESDLADLAWTLRRGREAMSKRLAVVAGSMAEFAEVLQLWLQGEGSGGRWFSGDTQAPALSLSPQLVALAAQGDPRDQAQLWALGHALPLPQSPAGAPRKLLQLPMYAFERQVVWRPRAALAAPAQPPVAQMAAPAAQAPAADAGAAYANNAEAFYSLSTMGASEEFREQYLTLCPYPERLPGHSMTRMFIDPSKCPEQFAYMQSRQIEMRQVLFSQQDFERTGRVFDIGCGLGTDVIQIAAQYPRIHTEGYTITGSQARLANQRIARSGLAGRALVHHRDSAKDRFPGRYDLVIGIEVTCHISDKEGVFSNIANALEDDGRVLLMDFIANGRGRITAPNIDIDISTRQDWIDVCADQGLVIDELIDVSPQIANFLYDPEAEANIAELPQVAKESFRNFANNYISLERGWVSYCLFRLRKEPGLSRAQRARINAERIAQPTPYPVALQRMRASGRSGYPLQQASARPESPPAVAAAEPMAAVRDALAQIFLDVLGIERAQVEQAPDLAALGVNSIHAVQLAEAINTRFDLRLPSSLLSEYPSFNALAAASARPAASAPPAPAMATTATAANHAATTPSSVRQAVEAALIETQGYSLAQLRGAGSLAELGLNSIHAVAVAEAINAALDLTLPSSILFEFPTLDLLVAAIAAQAPDRPRPVPSAPSWSAPPAAVPTAAPAQAALPAAPAAAQHAGYAIVGMSALFPGADSPQAFWRHIEQGSSRISAPPATRAEWRLHDGATYWGAFLERIDGFDPLCFGVTPKEAVWMSPEQRLLMTQVWRAFEAAGIAWDGGQRTGVFIASGPSDYPAILARQGHHIPKLVPSMLPNRISHAFDLKGPSENCEAACASALLAVHRALQSMEAGECEQVVVAAANLIMDAGAYQDLEAFNALSRNGECHPFQTNAGGYVRGEGLGALIIKPLARAEADGDRIYAVIRGTGIAHAGQGKSAMAADERGMAAAIGAALARAGTAPASVSYVEVQGMGSAACDQAEIRALAQYYAATPDASDCVIGTLKPVFGHCEYAASMASILKVVMALQHHVRPGIPGFGVLEPSLPLPPRFRLGAENLPWPATAGADGRPLPRRAAVHAFGIGGVNGHMILEEYIAAAPREPLKAAVPEGREAQAFPLSARDPQALRGAAQALLAHLESNAQTALDSVARTLQTGRVAMRERLALVADDRSGLLEGLRHYLAQADAATGARLYLHGRPAPASAAQAPGHAAAQLLASRWLAGQSVSWAGLHGTRPPPPLALPGYPLRESGFWPAATAPAAPGQVQGTVSLAPALRACVAEFLAPGAVPRPEQTLAELGLDSMARLMLLQSLRAALRIDLDAHALADNTTLAALSARLPAPPSAPAAPDQAYQQWLVPPLRAAMIGVKHGVAEVFRGGQGPRLLLIPGLGMSGSVFLDHLAALTAQYEVMVYHYPGLGRSSSIGSGDLDAVAAHLFEVLDAAAWGETAILGWSFGGLIAQKAALLRPRQCRALMLVSTMGAFEAAAPAQRPPASLRRLYEDDLEQVFAEPGCKAGPQRQRHIRAVLDGSQVLGALDGVAYLDALTRFDVSAALPHLALPVLIVAGTLDRFDQPRHSERLVSLIPGAKLVRLKGAGHVPFLTHPEAFRKALLRFLDKTHPGRSQPAADDQEQEAALP
ncbi:alpha/beta fold hydrolase [Pseudoduganella violacea]|uniref:Acyl transferase domain-containing protein/pimeloyl-ACP methyl ester carboxylesterase/SAM-dependent methyltransferase n=1 Tax=Pseudoduganella violacea TaxID=1715466 RepID=A0A7W5FVG6_9BURK|nr:alpha/beta fold hydrolase [Pseudoduganella violacea]MBB3120980.1 acyl transferase domain-containing protein/pimeloyl-ACP methyl ester carboxylesterase/SAM-dependent methyltransferase [Pseudoduganella violacea]